MKISKAMQSLLLELESHLTDMQVKLSCAKHEDPQDEMFRDAILGLTFDFYSLQCAQTGFDPELEQQKLAYDAKQLKKLPSSFAKLEERIIRLRDLFLLVVVETRQLQGKAVSIDNEEIYYLCQNISKLLNRYQRFLKFTNHLMRHTQERLDTLEAGGDQAV